MYIVAVLRDRLYCRVERSVLTVINEYVTVLAYKLIFFWLNFDGKALEFGLYMGPATQP